jgi:hypothetical protein
MEALLKYLVFVPAYAMDLADLLAFPKTFLKKKNRGDDQDWANALSFFGISIAIAFTLQETDVSLDTEFVSNLTKTILLSAVYTLTFSILIKIAWRLAGGRAPLYSIILTHLYVVSAYALITSCVGLIFVCLHAILYPEYYNEVSSIAHKGFFNILYQAINNPETPSLLSPEKYPGLLRLGIVMSGTSCLVSVAWITAIWGAYRQLNEASSVRSFAAFILCGMLSVPTFGILILLTAGGWMPSLKP